MPAATAVEGSTTWTAKNWLIRIVDWSMDDRRLIDVHNSFIFDDKLTTTNWRRQYSVTTTISLPLLALSDSPYSAGAILYWTKQQTIWLLNNKNNNNNISPVSRQQRQHYTTFRISNVFSTFRRFRRFRRIFDIFYGNNLYFTTLWNPWRLQPSITDYDTT